MRKPTAPITAPAPTRTTRSTAPHSCLCCPKQLTNPKHTICAACAEDMGYARKAR